MIRHGASYRPISRLILLAFGLGVVSLGGCAIHPLPDDFARISTYNIVRQVRCETRAAVIDSLLGFLTNDYNNDWVTGPRGNRYKKVDDASRKIGQDFERAYEADPDSIKNFDVTKLTGFARSVVGILLHTGIAYNYDLLGQEKNNIDPELNFLRPLPISTLASLNAKGNFDRLRQNERSFTITDNANDLIVKTPAQYCKDSIVEANHVYPIAGKVGMKKVVQDFLQLTLFGNLAGDGSKVTSVSGPPTMVDQLEFQTTIGGSVTPKVLFLPMGKAFQLADASLGLSASRLDTHKLTIGLYLDKIGAVDVIDVRTAVFSGLITASGNRAELGAARAVEQFLQQKIFRPTIIVQPL